MPRAALIPAVGALAALSLAVIPASAAAGKVTCKSGKTRFRDGAVRIFETSTRELSVTTRSFRICRSRSRRPVTGRNRGAASPSPPLGGAGDLAVSPEGWLAATTVNVFDDPPVTVITVSAPARSPRRLTAPRIVARVPEGIAPGSLRITKAAVTWTLRSGAPGRADL